MPDTIYYVGNEAGRKQKESYTISSTWVAAQTVTIDIDGKPLVYIIQTGDLSADVAAGLLELIQASNSGIFNSIDWSIDSTSTTILIAEAKTPGRPFTSVVSETSATGTITKTAIISPSGGEDFSATGNFQLASGTEQLPIAGDTLIIENTSSSILNGLDQLTVQLALVWFKDTFKGNIGRPEVNTEYGNEFAETQLTYLQLKATVLRIDQGSESGLIKIKNISVTQTTDILNTNAPSDEDYAVYIYGLPVGTPGLNSTLNIFKGNVGVCATKNTASQFDTINQKFIDNLENDTNIFCGSDLTYTTYNKEGGNVTFDGSTMGTLNNDGGFAYIKEGTTHSSTAINVLAGSIRDHSSGTGTLIVYPGGGYDRSGATDGKTLSAIELHTGFTYIDRDGTITASNGIDFFRCTPADGTLGIPRHQTMTLAAI